MGRLNIPSMETGHDTITWDSTTPDELLSEESIKEIERAEAAFEVALKEKKMAAFTVDAKDGRTGDQISEFDRTQEVISFMPQMAGG